MDDFKTFRHPLISLFQSAAADYASKISYVTPENKKDRSVAGQTPQPQADLFLRAVQDFSTAQFEGTTLGVSGGRDALDRSLASATRTAGELSLICVGLGYKYLEALVVGNGSSAARLKGQLASSVCDPGWASTIEEYATHFGLNGTRATIPYVRPCTVGSAVITIKPNSKIALFGDWGTGADPARTLAKCVGAMKPDCIIHLGDIYYSGTEREVAGNFLKILNDEIRFEQPQTLIFALAGNHDMYSGGQAYYQLIKDLNQEPRDQKASFFCLRSADASWQFIALDTSLHDYSPLNVSDSLTFIEEEEEAWAIERCREFSGRTVILSHHQLFSAFSRIGPADPMGQAPCNTNLLGTFEKLKATAAKLPAWFWGHEHNLCVYEPFAGLRFGRCLGHGAVPVFLSPNPYAPIENLTSKPTLIAGTELAHNETVYANGFAILTLQAQELTAEYYQVLDGKQSRLFAETVS